MTMEYYNSADNIRFVIRSGLNYYFGYENDQIKVVKSNNEIEHLVDYHITKNDDFYTPIVSPSTYDTYHIHKNLITKAYNYGGSITFGILDTESRIFMFYDRGFPPIIIHFQDDAELPQRNYTDNNLKYLNDI